MKRKSHMLISSILILKSHLRPFQCTFLQEHNLNIGRDTSFVGFPVESGPTHSKLNRTFNVHCSVIDRMHQRKISTKESTKTPSKKPALPTPEPPQLPVKTRKHRNIANRSQNNEQLNISDTKAQLDGSIGSSRFSARQKVENVLNTSSITVNRVKRTLSDKKDIIDKGIRRMGSATHTVGRKLSDSLQNLSQKDIFQLNQRSTSTKRSDNPFVSVINYYFNETKYSLELDLDWVENFMSDVLLFYYIQSKFLLLLGIYNSDVKLPKNFKPRTTDDLFYLYIYTKNNFSNVSSSQIWKIKEENEKLKKKKEAKNNKIRAEQIDKSNKKGLEYDPVLKKNQIDAKKDVYIYMPGEIGVFRRICLNVYGYLQEKKFPNNRIPELLNKNGIKQLRNCFFSIANSKNIFLSDVKPRFFQGKDVFHDIEQMFPGAKIDLNVSERAVEEILQRSKRRLEKIMSEKDIKDLQNRLRCNMCWAIREFKMVNDTTNDSSDMENKSVLKSFAKKIARNTKKVDNKSYIRSRTYSEDKTTLILNYSTGIGLMFNPMNDSLLLREYFYEFFDFLYIKRILHQLIKKKGVNFQQSASLHNKSHTKWGDLFFLYIRHRNNFRVPDDNSKNHSDQKYKFDKFKKFPTFNEFFVTYIKASGIKNDIYTLLYSAQKIDLEIKVLTDYINRTAIQGDLLSKHSDEICPCCIIESEILFHVEPEHLNNAFKDYKTIFYEKVDRIYQEENQW